MRERLRPAVHLADHQSAGLGEKLTSACMTIPRVSYLLGRGASTWPRAVAMFPGSKSLHTASTVGSSTSSPSLRRNSASVRSMAGMASGSSYRGGRTTLAEHPRPPGRRISRSPTRTRPSTHRRLGPDVRTTAAPRFVLSSPRLALSATGHGERDQQENDPHATHDVRNHGDCTGEIARVGPDQTHDRSHDEQGDRSGEPEEDPSSSDDGILASGALGREGLRPAVQLADRVHVSQLGERSPASSSRYSRTLTPSSCAARATDQPARFRSSSSIVGSIATGGSVLTETPAFQGLWASPALGWSCPGLTPLVGTLRGRWDCRCLWNCRWRGRLHSLAILR